MMRFSRASQFRNGGIGLSLVALVGCAAVPRHPASLSKDLPAFVQVDPGFYRGGQPTPKGLEQLAAMGVKTIINLRHHSPAMDWERELAHQLGMRWINIPMRYWWPPSQRQIQHFLRLVEDPAAQPVFAHCQKGQNRVGLMVAIYRIVHYHWTPAHAYAEGRRLGMVPWNPFTHSVLFRAVPGPVTTSAPPSPNPSPPLTGASPPPSHDEHRPPSPAERSSRPRPVTPEADAIPG